MKVPFRMMACCSSTGESFMVDGVIENRRMVWQRATKVPAGEAEAAKAKWQGPPLGEVAVDASQVRCPCCGGANAAASLLFCHGCSAVMCGGLDRTHRAKGACGKCSWSREEFGPAAETFPTKAAVLM